MPKVFISTSSFGKYDASVTEALTSAALEVVLNPHGRQLTADEAAKSLRDVEYLIAGTEPLNKTVLEKAQKLKVISRCGVGLDNIDLKAAEKLGILIYSTPQAPTVAVAELTVGLILDLLRQVSATDRDLRKGKWNKRMGELLYGKRIGIIGLGRIGQRVAELLFPFGTQISYNDVISKSSQLPYLKMDLDKLLKWADIVTLHCSTNADSSKEVLGAAELKKIRKGGWVVNVARGGAVNEEALYKYLKEGHLAGAALDVFDEEPYQGKLAELDNVVLTTHIGSYAREARIAMEKEAVANLLTGIKNIVSRGVRPYAPTKNLKKEIVR